MKQEKLQRQSVVISADGVDAGPAETGAGPHAERPRVWQEQRACGFHGSAVTTTASIIPGKMELSCCSIACSPRGF